MSESLQVVGIVYAGYILSVVISDILAVVILKSIRTLRKPRPDIDGSY